MDMYSRTQYLKKYKKGAFKLAQKRKNLPFSMSTVRTPIRTESISSAGYTLLFLQNQRKERSENVSTMAMSRQP